MARKRTPQAPIAYAEYLYMAKACNGAVSTMADSDIINMRVRAFVDGVNWQKRRPRRRMRT